MATVDKVAELREKSVIFAEDRLHSAMNKQVCIALIGTIIAEDRLHSAMNKQVCIALIGTIIASIGRSEHVLPISRQPKTDAL